MPCYNESTTLEEITKRVLASPYTAELVIVDDKSTDGTRELLADIEDPRVRVLTQPLNTGKGAALRKGFSAVSGDFVIVQDADLEYNPDDWELLLAPLLAGDADVVYGSRFAPGACRPVSGFWHAQQNKLLTRLSNAFTNLNLTDMETCYKAFRREVIQSITIQENRFGVEPEITAKIASGGWRIWEVGISYSSRTRTEGKKITWRDGVAAVFCIIRYGLQTRRNQSRAR